MRKFMLGSAVLAISFSIMPTASDAARIARGVGASRDAIADCRARYSGDRGRAGNQLRSMLIEGCFREKTGSYPFEVGVPLYPPGYSPRYGYGPRWY